MSSAAAADAPQGKSPEVLRASPLAKFFFLKTTFGILVSIGFVVGGLVAYNQLVKEALPELDIPRATVATAWPGAGPLGIGERIHDGLGDELPSLRGVRPVPTASFDPFPISSVESQAGVHSGDAVARLRASVSDAEAELPVAAERPAIDQLSVDDRPIFTLAIYGEADAATLSGLARSIRDQLERVPGVNEVDLGGAREEIIQILLRPERMLALGLSPTAVR